MKKRHSKKPKKRKFPIALAIFVGILIIVAAILIVNYPFELEEESTSQPESPDIQDFPSDEEGTLDGWIQSEGFSGHEPSVLFSSSKIQGLAIVYYPQEKRLIAGLPPLVANEINLFDGKEHNLIYTFKKGGEQILLIDKQIVASGKYKVYTGGGITGMAIGVKLGEVSNVFERLEIS